MVLDENNKHKGSCVETNLINNIKDQISKHQISINELEKQLEQIEVSKEISNGKKLCGSCETYSLVFTGETLNAHKGYEANKLKKYSCTGCNTFSYYID